MNSPNLTKWHDAVIEAWGRPRILIQDKDVTLHPNKRGRQLPTIPLGFNRQRPFTYGSATYLLPWVGPREKPGVGRLKWLDMDAWVRFAIVQDGVDITDRKVLHRGQVAGWRHREDGTGLEITVEGRFFTAANQIVPPSLGHLPNMSLEKFCAKVIKDIKHRRFEPMLTDLTEPTGLTYNARGTFESPMAMLVDALATGLQPNGDEYTIDIDDAANAPVFRKAEPRNTWTFTYGQPGLQADLYTDHRLRVDAVYGSGIAPNGGAWRNSKYPHQDDSEQPAYPVSPGTTFGPGSTTPPAFGAFWERLDNNGYKVASTATHYAATDEADVRDWQEQAGILVDGIVGPQTWAAVLKPGRDSWLGDAFIAPLAAVKQWDKYLRSPSGAVLKNNPAYDQPLVPQERLVEYGEGITKAQGLRSARAMLRRENNSPTLGSFTASQDPEEGSRFDMEEGDIIRLRHYEGGTLRLFAPSLDYDLVGGTVTGAVSTRRGPYQTVAGEIAQRRETKASRRASNGLNTGGTAGVVWDSESPAGKMPRMALYPNLGAIMWTPMPVWGQVARTTFAASVPAEFVVAVFSKPVTPGQIEAILGGNPLTMDDPAKGFEKALEDAGMVIGWGSKLEPLGYGVGSKPQLKPAATVTPVQPVDNTDAAKTAAEAATKALQDAADDAAKTAHEAAIVAALDGTFKETNAWDFRIPDDQPPYLRVLVWADRACTIDGRFLPGVVS